MSKSSPSKIELEVLKTLWREGELSARELHDALSNQMNWSLSTSRTVLDRMVEKGLLQAKSIHRLKIYVAASPKTKLLGLMVNRYLRRVLEIDGPIPLSSFTGSTILTPSELKELERCFQDVDEGEQ